VTRFTCSGDWLVEYADGELSAADTAQAELHLAACPGCSREVAALRSSREALGAYFASAGDREVEHHSFAKMDGLGSPSYKLNAAAMALMSVAASILLVSMVFFLGRETGEVVKVVPPPAKVPAASSTSEQTEDDVLALISRETQIARLRMASEILAKEPGMNDRHLAIEKYLTQAYGVTTKRQPFEM
jgi:anti-sigma factor RsiW